MDGKEIYRELRRLSAFNGWGVLGVFIPLIGLILYGIAISRANTLLNLLSDTQKKEFTKEVIKRKTTSKGMLVVIILLALLYGLVGYAISQRSTNSGRSQQETATAPTVQTDQEMLNKCLDNVNTWYEANRANVQTVYQEQNLLTEKQQKIDECELRS